MIQRTRLLIRHSAPLMLIAYPRSYAVAPRYARCLMLCYARELTPR